MPLTALYSTTNLQNSFAMFFAGALLDAGYLVYFLRTDMLRTPDNWYPNYSTQQSTYALNSVYTARLAASKGLVTLHDGETAFPRLLARPTNEGAVGDESEVQVPVFGISVDPDVPLQSYEVGARLFWRTRGLHIDGRVRDRDEMIKLADLMAVWFDENVEVPVSDYHASVEPPGTATVTRRSVVWNIAATAGDADRFQLELHARLEYVA